ncbi:MAG: hypothetical protein V1848_00790 [Candidatus Magasanikbacteria bacterium]
MYLRIDMSVNNVISLALFQGKEKICKSYEGRNRELLESLSTFLEEEKKSPKDIQGIAVVVGVGSFTSTRIATVIANVFGFVENIPIIRIFEDEKEKYALLEKKLKKQKKGVYISAKYSGEPNIQK